LNKYYPSSLLSLAFKIGSDFDNTGCLLILLLLGLSSVEIINLFFLYPDDDDGLILPGSTDGLGLTNLCLKIT
jgi:hypothetical protein